VQSRRLRRHHPQPFWLFLRHAENTCEFANTNASTRAHLFFFLPFLLLPQASDPRVKLFHCVASTSRRLQLLGDISKNEKLEMRKNERGSYADIVTRECGRRAELLRLTQKEFFEPQRQKRAQPSCCNCKEYVNVEGNLKKISAYASYPRARLCFLPLMWSSQATLSFRVQSQTWGDVKTSPHLR
jgi:hypothetical protein